MENVIKNTTPTCTRRKSLFSALLFGATVVIGALGSASTAHAKNCTYHGETCDHLGTTGYCWSQKSGGFVCREKKPASKIDRSILSPHDYVLDDNTSEDDTVEGDTAKDEKSKCGHDCK